MVRSQILRKSKGFTLIELLVVIAIIGLLAGIAIPLFLGQRTKAMKIEGDTNVKIIYTANENFYAENGRYAPNPDSVKTYGDGTTNALELELRALKFGKTNDLNFAYKVESCPDTSGLAGQAFLATATGKPGTPIAGMVFTINQKNEMGDGSVGCGL